jgi:hypothetical protein
MNPSLLNQFAEVFQMAISSCGKCGGHYFELKEVSPSNATYKSVFVQCSNCGVPAGVIGYTNPAVRIDAVAEQLEKKIAHLESGLSRIHRTLEELKRSR